MAGRAAPRTARVRLLSVGPRAGIIGAMLPSDSSPPQGPSEVDATVRSLGSRGDLDELESIIDEQWLAWYLLSPLERWSAAQEMWRDYLAMGGSLEPEVDSQSPFFELAEPDASSDPQRRPPARDGTACP